MSDELERAGGELTVAGGDAGFGVRRPAHDDVLVADLDVGVMVLGLGELREPVDERDRGREAVEHELSLERPADLAPTLVRSHPPKYRVFRHSGKQAPTRELVCEYVYRPLAHLVVLALLPLRVAPPVVVVAAGTAGIAAAAAIVRGELLLAAALLVAKTVLDNADGQLARASGRVTAFGRYLDSESDLLVNASLFAALGYGTHRPLLALVAFLVLTLMLSVNFNLRRLYELERGRGAEAMPPAGDGATAALRRIYEIVYAPQDRLVERFVRRRLRRFEDAAQARLAYHDRASIALLHNLGLSGITSALAVCLSLGRPQLALWAVLVCGLTLVPLELRRGIRAARATTSALREGRQTC